MYLSTVSTVATCKESLTPFDSFCFFSLSLSMELFFWSQSLPCTSRNHFVVYNREYFLKCLATWVLNRANLWPAIVHRWLLIAVLAIIVPMSTVQLEPRFMAISAVVSILSVISSSGFFRAYSCDFAIFSLFEALSLPNGSPSLSASAEKLQ